MRKVIMCAICMVIAFGSVSCSKEEPGSTKKGRFSFLEELSSPYCQLLDDSKEIYGTYTFTDMHLFQDTVGYKTYSQNTQPNTIFLGTNNQRSIIITDSCETIDKSSTFIYRIGRDIHLLPGARSLRFAYSSELRKAAPIVFIRPYATKCDPTPFCYYRDMEIEWNADLANPNGVVVVIEWQGGMAYGESLLNTSVVTGTLVEDNGVTVLDNDLFDDMPDGALVNMWLLRADLAKFSHEEAEDDIRDIIESVMKSEDYGIDYAKAISSVMQDSENPIAVNGSVALLPIILVKNL